MAASNIVARTVQRSGQMLKTASSSFVEMALQLDMPATGKLV
jgi:hypothetical protein